MKGLPISAVTDKIGTGKTFVYAEMKRGRFPRPIRLGTKSVWIESEVDQYLADRAAERGNGDPDPMVERSVIATEARKAKRAAKKAQHDALEV